MKTCVPRIRARVRHRNRHSRHEAETALEQEAKSYNEDLGAYEITERYFKTQGGGFWVKYAEGSEARARSKIKTEE